MEPSIFILVLVVVAVYVWACYEVSTNRSRRYSAFEAFLMCFLFSPLLGVLINILAKMKDVYEVQNVNVSEQIETV